MRRLGKKALMLGTAVFVAGVVFAPPVDAQNQKTPRNFSYEIKDGKRVPKGNRVTNADGSWRETMRQGNCVTIKEKSATGEYKETRQCNPN